MGIRRVGIITHALVAQHALHEARIGFLSMQLFCISGAVSTDLSRWHGPATFKSVSHAKIGVYVGLQEQLAHSTDTSTSSFADKDS